MALFGKPRYSTVKVKRKDIPTGLWTKCPASGEIIYNKELEANWMVVPKSGYHFGLSAPERMRLLLDEDTFVEHDAELRSLDPLRFRAGGDAYPDKIVKNQRKTGLMDSVLSGEGAIEGTPVSIAVMDFRFMAASMGSVAGEKIARTIERGTHQGIPVIVVCASGGARMQEGILSLMQMAKTSAALKRHQQKGLPYVSILTNPTMAGVMASFAALGDVILAEPGALIGFAGPRVIKDATNQDLPAGFQSSEFLLEHGLIDQVVPRLEMRERLHSLLGAFYRGEAQGKNGAAHRNGSGNGRRPLRDNSHN